MTGRNIKLPSGAMIQLSTTEITAEGEPKNGYVSYDTVLGRPVQYVNGAWVALYPQGGSLLPYHVPMLESETNDTYSVVIDGTNFTFSCKSYTNISTNTRARECRFIPGATKLYALLMSASTENRSIYWASVGRAPGEAIGTHTNGRGATTGALTIAFTADVLVKQELVNGLNGFTDGDIINLIITAANSSASRIYCFGWLME